MNFSGGAPLSMSSHNGRTTVQKIYTDSLKQMNPELLIQTPMGAMLPKDNSNAPQKPAVSVPLSMRGTGAPPPKGATGPTPPSNMMAGTAAPPPVSGAPPVPGGNAPPPPLSKPPGGNAPPPPLSKPPGGNAPPVSNAPGGKSSAPAPTPPVTVTAKLFKPMVGNLKFVVPFGKDQNPDVGKIKVVSFSPGKPDKRSITPPVNPNASLAPDKLKIMLRIVDEDISFQGTLASFIKNKTKKLPPSSASTIINTFLLKSKKSPDTSEFARKVHQETIRAARASQTMSAFIELLKQRRAAILRDLGNKTSAQPATPVAGTAPVTRR